MNNPVTLAYLQAQIGAEYVEANPVTGKPRIIQGLNEVWEAIDEHGGVSQVAKLFGLSELAVWGWVDDHDIPALYVPYLTAQVDTKAKVPLSSVGCEDSVKGEFWPKSWALETAC